MEYIKIDVLEELLKAIEIVHGRSYAAAWRLAIYKWEESHRSKP